MAENEAIQEEATVDESPQGETEATGTDWKAEARKWERYAKKAQAAEKELEELKAAQMTEQEKAEARAKAAEDELARIKAEQKRDEAKRRISEADGVPIELLEYCADIDSMEKFAADYKAHQTTVHAAASASASRLVKGNTEAATEENQFVRQLFKNQ